jgi:hypothetical protein
VDFANPARPRQVGVCHLLPVLPGAWVYGVALIPPYAYVAGQIKSSAASGVFVVDCTNPAQPQCVTFVAVDTGPAFARDIVVSGSYLYVAAEEDGLIVMDAQDPGNPVEVARYYDTTSEHSLNSVSVVGNLAFAPFGSWGLRILNVSDPLHPTLNGFYSSRDDYQGVFAVGDTAHLCAPFGFSVIQSGPAYGVAAARPSGSEAISLEVCPNPARRALTIRYSTPRPGPVSFSLYNTAGRLAWKTAVECSQAGAHSLKFDARAFARGLYFLRGKIGDNSLTRGSVEGR